MLRHERGETVDVHDIFGALLVLAAEDEAELLGRHADGLEDLVDDIAVVDGAIVDELERGLEVVEELQAEALAGVSDPVPCP